MESVDISLDPSEYDTDEVKKIEDCFVMHSSISCNEANNVRSSSPSEAKAYVSICNLQCLCLLSQN